MLKQFTNKLNRRGISPVVATILIVLVTIAAASFIAGIIVPLVKNRLNEGTECIGYEDYFTFYEEFDYNCYLDDGGIYRYAFSVQADSVSQEKLANVKGFRIQFLSSGESKSVDGYENQISDQNSLRMLDASLSSITLPKQGGVKTFVYSENKKYNSIEIYPVLKNGRICDKSDEIKLGGFVCTTNLN